MNKVFLNPEIDVIDYLLDNINLKNLYNYLFVFPGNRPKMFLIKKIAERLKNAFEPPLIFSFENFIGFINQTSERALNILSDVELLSLLYDINIDNKLYTKYKKHLSLFFPFAQKVLLDYALIVKSGKIEILKQEKDKILKKYKGTDIYSTILDYLDIIVAIDQRIKSENKSISSEIFCEAAKIEESKLTTILSKYEKVFFIDIIPLFESESIFIGNVAKLKNIYLIYQKSQYLSNFRFIKDVIKTEDINTKFIIKNANIYESPDIHGQVLQLKEELLTKRGKKEFDLPDTLLMLPKSSTLRIVSSLLLNELKEDSFNVSMGISISGMQMSEYLNLIFDMISESTNDLQELKASNFYKFINHIYMQSLKENLFNISEDIYRKLGQTVYEYLGVEELKEQYKSNQIFSKLIYEVFEELRKVKTIGDFSRYICNLIKFISENQNGSLNYGYFHIEAAKILESFKALSNSSLKDIEIKRSEYKSVFNYFVSSLVITPSGSPLRGLQVLGIYESRAIRFKDVYILDFNDESFFDYDFEDSFLPYQIKLQLGIPPRSEYDNYMLYFIDLLFAQSENITVFYRAEDKFTKHRYLLRYIYECKKLKKQIESTPIYYNINLTLPEPIDIKKGKLTEKILEKPLTATGLNTYLKCPANFYYSNVLNLEEREEIDDKIEGDMYGVILHSTLKEYFAEHVKQKFEGISKEILFGILKEEYNKRVKYRSDSFLIHYAVLEVVLENFIDIYKKNIDLFNGKIIELESVHEIEVQIKGKKVKLSGRFDRVDMLNDSKIHIIDYKLAKHDNYKIVSEGLNKFQNNIKDFISERKKYVKKNNNIQLPFYIYLVSKDDNLKNHYKDFQASFVFLRNRGNKCLKSIPNHEKNNMSINDYNNIVESMIEEIINPDVPFFPVETDDCKYCDFYSICHRNL